MDFSLLPLTLFWIAFFILHSILASNTLKDWIARSSPRVFKRYRLLYNLIAVITIVPALALARFTENPVLWQWQGYLYLIAMGLNFLAILGFVISTRYYDMGVFLGLVPGYASHAGKPEESFTLSPFHRYVRHPWYFFGIVLIWTQEMTVHWLVSCILVTLYFWLGSILEEQKLVMFYGEQYRQYQRKVPRLFPVPWRYLSKPEAETLMASANH